MSEWLKEAVLKTVDVKASVGSNPTISAIFSIIARGNTQVAIRGSPAKGVDGLKPCVGSNPTFRARKSTSFEALFLYTDNMFFTLQSVLRSGIL